MTTPSELRRLLDVHDVEAVLRTYCRAIDRADRSLLAGCFHPDAILHYPGYAKDQGDYVTWVFEALRRFAGRMHYLSNVTVDVDGDVAWTESYLHAHHWGDPPGDPMLDYAGGSRYVDRLERRDGVWKIAERTVVRAFREDKTTGSFAAGR